jgi:predicted dehydrogenase
MAAKFRVGLVGCGRIGAWTRRDLLARLGPNWFPLSHADGIKAVDDFSLVACCDVDREAAAAAAARYGAKLIYVDYATMLKDAELDVLCVATRSDVRADILCAAAQTGVRAVHSEKPLALSVGRAEAASNAVDGKGMAFSYGTLRSYMPIFRRAAIAAHDGSLGKLQAVSVKFGRTSLMWNHPHTVGLLCLLCGSHDAEFVQANLSFERGLAGERLIDTDPLVLSATIAFDNGVTGHIVDHGAKAVEIGGSERMLSIVGDGSAMIESDLRMDWQGDPIQLWKFTRDDAKTSGRLLALLELRDALTTRKRTTLSAEDAWKEHRLLFAMAQSDREGGRRVRPKEVDPEFVITGRSNGRVA